MKYKDNFIPKFETEHFYIGSFDAYIDEARNLIIKNQNVSEDDANNILKNIPTTYRASILDKNGNYIGFIGLYDIDLNNSLASLHFEMSSSVETQKQQEILNTYNDWVKNVLNINDYIERKVITPYSKTKYGSCFLEKPNIIIPTKFLRFGIKKEDLEKYKVDYQMPNLVLPHSIIYNNKTIGIIGLSNVLWSNKRANLNIYFDKELGDDIASSLSPYLIDEYLNYTHKSNIHNVNFEINESNNLMLDIIKDTNMAFYGNTPYSIVKDNKVESKLLFQHIPDIKKDKEIYVPLSAIELDKIIETNYIPSKVIELDEDYRLVCPMFFDELNINKEEVLKSHIKAMQNRNSYTIPLGEDKYILQLGNGNYGISKAFNNYDYVVLDSNNNYAGYINTLDSNEVNARIEIGIDPKVQNKGIGTKTINAFYDEMFKRGYLSISSIVFDFNKSSLALHDKVADLDGIRLESYYINGKLWNMNYYTKVNEKIK